jgi:hypothetical protein
MPRRSRKEQLPFENGLHADDIEQYAKECILTFFSGKRYYLGDDIPQVELLSSFCLKTVLRTEINEYWRDIVHRQCLIHVQIDPEWEDLCVSYRVEYLLNILRELQSYGFPKEFFGGLVLLYFKFCYGVEIG